MSKFSHFTAVGLLIAAGYALSLGSDGRAQVASIYDAASTSVADAVGSVTQFSHQLSEAVSNISLASAYSALGVFAGILPNTPTSAPAAVSTGVVVTEQGTAASSADQVSQIKANFSDVVKVKPDASKKSGTITPVFKGVPGQNYTYVIVPVKK